MAKFSMPDKLNLAQIPTPIQYLPRLSKAFSRFGDIRLFVKRDDMTHGPAAGNKIRKLEYLLGDALQKGARHIVTCGAVQSNHARATALLCKQLGLECALFLKGEAPIAEASGNLLLDLLVGAQVEFVTPEVYEQMPRKFLEFVDHARENQQPVPYFIPEGGSNEVGAMGYVEAFNEIRSQCGKNGLPDRFSSIVLANGSGGTHGGLLLGRNLSDWEPTCSIISFNVCRTAPEMAERVKRVVLGAIQRYRIPISFMPADIDIIDGYVGPAYGVATDQGYDFLVRCAREDGLLLDPVYTGKALFGLWSELSASEERAQRFGRDILFIHTGGLPSLFTHHAQGIHAALQRASHG